MARPSESRNEHLYGINPVSEALNGRRRLYRLLVRDDRRDDRRIVDLVSSARDAGIPVDFVDRARLQDLTGGGNHQGVVLEAGPFPYVDLDTLIKDALGRPFLVLDHVQDPQNLATLIRTSAAVNVAGIVIQADRSAVVTPAVVRSSSGLVEQTGIARVTNTRRAIEELKRAGYWAAGLQSGETSTDIFSADIPDPTVLVVGAEARGISESALRSCDLLVQIPMPGRADSLNAAIAGSVALYELLRRRERYS